MRLLIEIEASKLGGYPVIALFGALGAPNVFDQTEYCVTGNVGTHARIDEYIVSWLMPS